jgi:AraC-like DNA-binding protein
MQSPLQIHFPPALCGDLKISNEYPPDCKYKIPFATVSLTVCDLGDFLTQFVNGDDYWMELWSFSVKKSGYIDIIIHQPYISIAMFLKGSLYDYLLGDGMVISPAKTYNIFYLPTGKQRMNLFKGDYVLLFFIPPQYYLNSMAVEHSSMKDILNRLVERNEEGAFLTNFPMPHAAWQIIKRLEKTNKKGAALDLELRQYILEILGLYNEQFNRNRMQPASYVTTREKAVAIRDHILDNLGDINLGGLNELTLLFHVTAKPLTKEFKTLTGKTVPQFITDERLEWAKRLLQKKDMHVFEIALIVGFSDTANFARKFKKKFGYAPGKRKDKDSSSK